MRRRRSGYAWAAAGSVMTRVTFTGPDGNQLVSDDVVVMNPSPIRLDLPLVVLLHGNNGTIGDMANQPRTTGNQLRLDNTAGPDRRARLAQLPGIGVRSVALDAWLPVVGWQPALHARGFSTLNYQQSDPSGLLATAVLSSRRCWTSLIPTAHSPSLPTAGGACSFGS